MPRISMLPLGKMVVSLCNDSSLLTLLHSSTSSSPCSSSEQFVKIRNQQSRLAEATMRSGRLVSSVGSKRVSQWTRATPFMTLTADTGSDSTIPEGMDANDIWKVLAADQERKLEVLEEKSRKVKEANAPFSSGKFPYVPSMTQLESIGVNRPLDPSTQQRRRSHASANPFDDVSCTGADGLPLPMERSQSISSVSLESYHERNSLTTKTKME